MNNEKRIVRNLLIFLGLLIVIWSIYIIVDLNKPYPTQNKINEILSIDSKLKEQKYEYIDQNVLVKKSLIYDENKIVKYDVQYSEIKKDKNAAEGFNDYLVSQLEEFNKSLNSKEGITHKFDHNSHNIKETLIYDFTKLDLKELIVSKQYAYPEDPENGFKLSILEESLISQGFTKK